MPGTKRKGAPKYHGAGNPAIVRRKINRFGSAPSKRGGIATNNPLDRCFIKVTKMHHGLTSSVNQNKIFGNLKIGILSLNIYS